MGEWSEDTRSLGLEALAGQQRRPPPQVISALSEESSSEDSTTSRSDSSSRTEPKDADKTNSSQVDSTAEAAVGAGAVGAGTAGAGAAGRGGPVVVEAVTYSGGTYGEPRKPVEQDLGLVREGRVEVERPGEVPEQLEQEKVADVPPGASSALDMPPTPTPLAQQRPHLSCAAKTLGCCVILLRCVCLLLLGGALAYAAVLLSGLLRELTGESVWEWLSSKGQLGEEAGWWARVGLYGLLGAASLVGVMALSGACGAVGLLGERRCCLCCDCVAAVVWALLVLGLLGGAAWGFHSWTEVPDVWQRDLGRAMQLRPFAKYWEQGPGLLGSCCGAVGTSKSYCQPLPVSVAASLIGERVQGLLRDEVRGRFPGRCYDVPALLRRFALYQPDARNGPCDQVQSLVTMLEEEGKGKESSCGPPLSTGNASCWAESATNGRLSFVLCGATLGKVVRGEEAGAKWRDEAYLCVKAWAAKQKCPGLAVKDQEVANLVLLLLRAECVVPESCCGGDGEGCGAGRAWVKGWWLGKAEERPGCGAEALGKLRTGLLAALVLLSLAAVALLAEAASQHSARRRLRP